MERLPDMVIDHAVRLPGALKYPFSESRVARALLSAVGRQLQDLESAFWQLIYGRMLDGSVGAQLVFWGDLFDEPKGELTDAEWRQFLKAKLLLRRSEGRLNELAAVLRIITGDHGPVHVYPLPPWRIGFQYYSPVPLSASHRQRVKDWMTAAIPAPWAIEHIIEARPGAFALDSDHYDLTKGLDAGLLAEVI